MARNTIIQWADDTLNALLGCYMCSLGCFHCYALYDIWRMGHNPRFGADNPYAGLVEKHPITRVEAITPDAAYANLSLPRCGYNAVLCNLYRGGNDSVGLHADNEPEMGPIIASVSLGAERLFRLRRNGGGIAFWERLYNGSLLIMAGHTQEQFKHEVPKEPSITQPRINLTFRRIEHK